MTAVLILFQFLRRGEMYDSFDLGHVMGFTVGSTYFLHHIAVHSSPGLDDARFRATRVFPASWWTTAVLGLFYFHQRGEIYHTIRQGDFGDFCRHNGAQLQYCRT
jgi:hypothetical protein